MPFSTQTQYSLKNFKTYHLVPNVGNNYLEIHKHFKAVALGCCVFFHILVLIKNQKYIKWYKGEW